MELIEKMINLKNSVITVYYMAAITTSLKFSFGFDVQKLVTDLEQIEQSTWVSHFNTGGYDGEWNVIPLYSMNGSMNNIYAYDPNNSVFLRTPLLGNCQYFQEVLAYFQCSLQSVRILKLKAGSRIKPHRDHDLGYDKHVFRLHVPIVTNESVEFLVDKKRIFMNAGECWYINAGYIHSVHNKSTEDRVHLVIDCKRNLWTDSLFFSHASEDSFIEAPTERKYSQTDIKRIIEELKMQDSPAVKALIQEFSALMK